MAGSTTTITAPGGITIKGGTLASDSGGVMSSDAKSGNIQIQNLNTHGPTPPAASAGVNGGNILVQNNAASGKNISVSGSIDSGGSAAVGGGNHNGGNGGSVTVDASGTLAVAAVTSSG